MRVTVSYSIDLEDVPLKVSSLIAEIHQNLKNSCELVANSSSILGIENDSMKSIKDIETAQNIVLDVSEQLGDMKNILIGYQRILLSNSEKPEDKEETIGDETYNSIQNMKNLLDQINVPEEINND